MKIRKKDFKDDDFINEDKNMIESEEKRDILEERELINMKFISFEGEQRSERIERLFEQIVFYNREIKEKQISIEFENDAPTKDENKIWEYVVHLKEDYNYNVIIEYDKDDFINLVKVQLGNKREVTEQDIIDNLNKPVM